MEDILQYVAEHCSGVKELDVTACSLATKPSCGLWLRERGSLWEPR